MALALAIGATEIGATYLAAQNQPEHRHLDTAGMALLASGAAALVFRRQYPVVVLLLVKTTMLLYWLLDYPRGPVFLAAIVALFTVVMHGHRLVAWLVLLSGFVSFPWLPYLLGRKPAPAMLEILGLAGWLLLLGTVAEVVRVRQEHARAARRTREEERRRQASEERLRIARELHDIVGHHLSLINVQAGVALHLMDQRPEQARIALSTIKEVSKDTLQELRWVLDHLRQVDEEPLYAPSPSLARLDDLVARAAAAGLQVRTEIQGDLQRLPITVELAAFRIVQEALTNVIKHAGPASATVRVVRQGEELTLQVEDNGQGAVSLTEAGTGKGILGMQERAAALGGVVEAGRLPDGGFRVLARLPIEGAS